MRVAFLQHNSTACPTTPSGYWPRASWTRSSYGSAKSALGKALAYIDRHWDGLQVFLDDGRVEMDTNAVENRIRPLALTRKNALFAGHDEGAPGAAGPR